MNRLLPLGALAALALSCPPAHAGILAISDLLAQKTAPETALPDTDITYQISVTNLGPDPAASVVLSDPLPGDLAFVSVAQDTGPVFSCTDPGAGNGGTVTCSIASLAVGVTAQFTLVAHVPPTAAPGTNYTNIATASTQSSDPNEENNAGVAGTNLPSAQADAGIMKFAADRTGPGENIEYTITLSNGGPDAATDLQWTDTLPGDLTFVSLSQDSGPTLTCTTPAVGAGGTVQCAVATFPVGVTATFTLVANVPGGTPSGTQYTNSVAVQHGTADPNSENDVSTITTTVSAVDLAASKSGPATADAGTQILYTLGITNNGPDDVFGASLVDTLPASLTFASITQISGPAANCSAPPVGSSGLVACSLASLGVGQSATFELRADVPADAPNGTLAVNSASAGAADQFDTDAGNDSASVQTQLVNTADVRIAKSAPASANAGGTLAWTVTATNDGPDVAAGVSITDALPAGTTFVSAVADAGLSCSTPAVGSGGTVTCNAATLASGASAGVVITAQVDDATPDATVILNSASVASISPADPDASDNTAQSSTTIVNRADVGVTKTAPASVAAGGTLAYTIVASNAGPLGGGLTLSDALPAGTTFVSLAQTSGTPFSCTTPAVGAGGSVQCSVAALAAGASAGFTLTVAVDGAAAHASVIANTASVDGVRLDPAAGNDSASATTTVNNQADLAVAKSAPGTVVAGNTLAYTLTVTNNGPLADSVTLTDALPGGTTFASITQGAGPAFSCSAPAAGATGTVTCTQAAFASGASAVFTLTVNVPLSAAHGSVLTNTATVDGTRADPTVTNDSASASTTVSNQPNLAVVKTAPSQVAPGGSIAYTIDVANSGNTPAQGVTLTDVLPAQVRFASLAQSAGPAFACTTPPVGAGGTVSCTLPALAAGASARFTLTVTLAPGSNGTVTNTAGIATTSPDAVAGDNASAAGTLIGFAPASVAPITIPTLSWLGLLALAAALAMLGAALLQRAR